MTTTAEIGRKVAIGFERECVVIPLESIVPLRSLPPKVKESGKYRQILASIRAVGIIEPPAVVLDPRRAGTWLLLDGYLRIEALRDLGATTVECLVSKDDEAFTYNKRINRLAAIQEHRMIVRAVERGVSEERISEALGIDVKSVRRRFKLLDGICDEAAELLKDKPSPMAVIEILKKMRPLRQIEAAELMVGQNNFTMLFAKAMLAATPDNQLTEQPKEKSGKASTSEQMQRMERELANLQTQIKSVEETLGPDTLHLTVAKGYLTKLLGNARVVRWLAQNRPEYLSEFQSITEIMSTSPSERAGGTLTN